MGWFQDLRFAIRSGRAQLGFAIAAVWILAIGIGVNTTIFSILNSVLLRPLPYKNANRIVIVWEKRSKDSTRTNGVTPADYLDWRAQNRVFASLTAHDEAGLTLTGKGTPQRLTAVLASANMLATYGVQPLIGRGFLPSDETAGGHVALLSNSLWHRQFGGDRSVVGQTVDLDGAPYTVIGVAPRNFRMYFGRQPDVYLPLVLDGARSRDRGSHDLLVVGRLRPGITLEKAQADLTAISLRLEREWPAFNTGHAANPVPITSQLRDSVRPVLVVLSLAVAFVLLIACANVANLLLARGITRHREFAIRQALGAGRFRLIRLLLTESGVLAFCAGSLGVALGYAGLHAIKPMLPKIAGVSWIPGMESVSIDTRVLLFTTLLSLLTALTFGLAPAWQLSRTEINSGLKESGRASSASHTSSRLRDLLVVAETALSCVLLAGAALLLASFARLSAIDPGFQSHQRLSLEITVPRDLRQPRREISLYRSIAEKISALPSVRSAALTTFVPGSTNGWRWGLRTQEHPEQRTIQDSFKIWMKVVTPGFISAMGIPVVEGRNLNDRDSERGAPVVLLSETAAQRYFPGEDAIGKRIALGDEAVWRTVVGVVGSIKHLGLSKAPEPEIYVPLSQLDMPFSEISAVVYFSGQTGPLVEEIRRALSSVNASLAVGRVESIDELLAESTSSERFNTVLIGSLATIALLLASAGIYSVIAFLVAQQTREIGVRLALGASCTDILGLFVGRSVKLVVAGVIAGAVSALLLNRLLRSFLFDTSPASFFAYAVPAACLIAAGVLAAVIPAWQAARIDPREALQYD